MPRKDVLDAIREYTDPFRVTKGKDFRLKDFDPGDTRGLKMDKREAAELLQRGSEWLAMEQDILYAQDSWALLLVFQAMDAAGKDGTIKHVMSRVNPQGVDVFSFKQPSDEELSHDFLWRYAVKVPQRGRIGIFNRSYYEEVLVVRVHQELLKAQKLPPKLVDKRIWDERLADIARFEDYLTRQGVVVLKFYLNLSREQQKKRFMKRLDKPDKNWKFSAADVRERRYWDNYMHAYEEAIYATASKDAPWFVVPADNKWFSASSSRRRLLRRLSCSTSNIRKSRRIKERSSPRPAQSLSRKSRWTTRTEVQQCRSANLERAIWRFRPSASAAWASTPAMAILSAKRMPSS
jgi:PPK2 family polyphosphate:nucleotide phosphotransferase